MKSLRETHDDCHKKGMLANLESFQVKKIDSMIKIAEEDKQLIIDAKKRNSINSMFKLYYNVMHTLTEALVRFDKVISSNHQCLFAYLCSNYKYLDFDWNFFETVRIIRNGLCYDGIPIKETDWKNIEFQFNVYINTLKKEIQKRLDKYKE
jgi:hypothetical protein